MLTPQQEKLKKLQDLFKMATDSLTREEFVSAFKEVVAFVKKIESKNEAFLQDLKLLQQRVITELKSENETTFAKIKNRILEQISEVFLRNKMNEKMALMLSKHAQMLSEMEVQKKEMDKKMVLLDKKMSEVHSGKDADEEIIVGKVRSQIVVPTIEEIEQDLPKLKEPIRDALELFTNEDEKLKMSAVGHLQEELKKLREEIKAVPRGRVGGMRRIPIIKRINLTSQVDGQTRSFTLPRDTVDVLGIFGTQFPVNFDTADWSLSGNTLTLAAGITTPAANQTLFAIIETLFYG